MYIDDSQNFSVCNACTCTNVQPQCFIIKVEFDKSNLLTVDKLQWNTRNTYLILRSKSKPKGYA